VKGECSKPFLCSRPFSVSSDTSSILKSSLTAPLGRSNSLVYAGVGWLCFREKQDLQKELTFTVDYLGGSQSSW